MASAIMGGLAANSASRANRRRRSTATSLAQAIHHMERRKTLKGQGAKHSRSMLSMKSIHEDDAGVPASHRDKNGSLVCDEGASAHRKRMIHRASTYLKELNADLDKEEASFHARWLGLDARTWVWAKKKFLTPAWIAFFGVFLWIFCATTFYTHHNGWAVSKSFFYSMDVGLSIGFGAFPEPNEGSKMYTCVHILIGASLISGALGLFFEILLDKQEAIADEVESETKKNKNKEEPAPSAAWCPCSLPTYDENPTVFHVTGAFVAWILLGALYQVWYLDARFMDGLYFAVSGLSTGGLLAPQDFAPDTDTPEEHTQKVAVFWFIGWYVLVGVPIFGMCLGQGAAVLVSRYTAQKTKEKVNMDITAAEFQYAEALGNNDGQIDRYEFLQMSLLRLGVVDLDLLEMINDRFDELDVLNDGNISPMEMHAALVFNKYDVDGSGELEINEFIDMFHELQVDYDSVSSLAEGHKGPDVHKRHGKGAAELEKHPDRDSRERAKIVQIFANIDTTDSDAPGVHAISRLEFMEWWRRIRPDKHTGSGTDGGRRVSLATASLAASIKCATKSQSYLDVRAMDAAMADGKGGKGGGGGDGGGDGGGGGPAASRAEAPGGGDNQEASAPTHPDHHKAKEVGEYKAGDRVEVYWAAEKEYYPGKVRAVNRSKRTISVDYDDGDFDAEVHFFEARRRESRFAREGGLADDMSDYVVEMTRQ